MPVTLKIGDDLATIAGYEWDSSDEVLEALLNTTLDPEGSLGSDPDSDWTAARIAVRELGAEIISHAPIDWVPGR